MTKITSHMVAMIIAGGLTVLLLDHFSAHRQIIWELAYSHDESGQAISGSKQALIDAVRNGHAVRIYWSGRTVEHLADSFFLTILDGEVFAQIEAIQGQNPSLDPPSIEFRDNLWRAIFSTNGDRALKWFVQR